MRVSPILIVFGFLLASIEKAQPTDLVLLPELESKSGQLPSERLVFSGGTCSLRWIVRGEIRKNLRKPICEVFRVTDSTAVSLGDLSIPFQVTANPGADIVELAVDFEAPESERPSRFLLKVWNEAGAKRSLLTVIFIRAIPASTLDFLKGNTVHAVNFEPEDRTGWGEYLEQRGVAIQWSDEYPKLTGKSDLIFLRNGDTPLPVTAGKNSLKAVEVYFDESPSPLLPDSVWEQPHGGKRCRTHLNVLRLLETSADSQARLASLLDPSPFSR